MNLITKPINQRFLSNYLHEINGEALIKYPSSLIGKLSFVNSYLLNDKLDLPINVTTNRLSTLPYLLISLQSLASDFKYKLAFIKYNRSKGEL